jgi:Sulfotransferase family
MGHSIQSPVKVLVHIGYHKTGTSWLQHFVFEDPVSGYGSVGHQSPTHPVRRLVAEHPLHYDRRRIRRAFERLIRKVEAQGLLPVVSLERLSGNPYAGGHDSRQIADRLHDALPDARVLVVIREQRSLLAAIYKQYVKAGGTASLEQFLRPPTDRSALGHCFDFRFYEYDHLIGYYHRLYVPDNVLVLPFDQFVRDGRGFVERIASFAGRPIPERFLATLPYESRDNRSVSALSIAALRHVNRLAPRTELNPGPALESRAALWLTKRLKKPNVLERAFFARSVAASADARLRRIVDETVGDRYAESNRKTAELAELDLPSYGWPI